MSAATVVGIEGAAPAAPVSSLDYLEINRNNRPKGRRPGCARFSVKGIDLRSPNPESQMRYARVNCNCWDCAYCGPIKQKRFRAAIGREASARDLKRFLTLTLDPKKFLGNISYSDFRELHADDDEKRRLQKIAIQHLRETFNKFRVYLGRKYGKAVEYISVLELHESGMPHFHLLIDRFIPVDWIREVWQKNGGGHQVKIEKVQVRSGAAYISKYLAKQLRFKVPPRSRRITTSRGIKLLQKQKGPKCFRWTLSRFAVWTALDLFGRPQKNHENPVLTAEFDCEQILERFSLKKTKYRELRRRVILGRI